MFHVVDWAPTMLGLSDRMADGSDRYAVAVRDGGRIMEEMSDSGKAAATDGSDLGDIDGIDHSPALFDESAGATMANLEEDKSKRDDEGILLEFEVLQDQ